MGDIDDALNESIADKQKQVKTIPFKIPTNVSYMNRGKWKYDASVRNAYVWKSAKGTILLGFDQDHKCRILVKGKDTKRIDVEDLRHGFDVIEDILARY